MSKLSKHSPGFETVQVVQRLDTRACLWNLALNVINILWNLFPTILHKHSFDASRHVLLYVLAIA